MLSSPLRPIITLSLILEFTIALYGFNCMDFMKNSNDISTLFSEIKAVEVSYQFLIALTAKKPQNNVGLEFFQLKEIKFMFSAIFSGFTFQLQQFAVGLITPLFLVAFSRGLLQLVFAFFSFCSALHMLAHVAGLSKYFLVM